MELTQDKIKEITREFLKKYTKKTVDDDLNLFNSGLVNSLFAMQMILFIEKEFKLSIDNQDLDMQNFNSINSISVFVGNKLKNNQENLIPDLKTASKYKENSSL